MLVRNNTENAFNLAMSRVEAQGSNLAALVFDEDFEAVNLTLQGLEREIKTTQLIYLVKKPERILLNERISTLKYDGYQYGFILYRVTFYQLINPISLVILLFAVISIFLIVLLVYRKITQSIRLEIVTPLFQLERFMRSSNSGLKSFTSGEAGDIDIELLTTLSNNSQVIEIKALLTSVRYLVLKVEADEKRLVQQTKFQAIAETTQMLAHDIRKPFSVMKAILNHLEVIAKTPSILQKNKREIHRMMTQVDVMVDDIINFSREAKFPTSPNSIIDVINSAIWQIAQSFEGETFDIRLN